ncbi:MAG: hypothetical protein JNK90_28815, partial [Planctomycetaceae bacterium]|nr:hypothetical protein [Planctomycetaceae bacterium]
MSPSRRRKKSLLQFFKARKQKALRQRVALFETFEERRVLTAEPFNYPSGLETIPVLGPNEIIVREQGGGLVIDRAGNITPIPADATSVKIDAGAGRDVVRFEGNLNFRGVDLTVFSEEILVMPGASLSAGDITFKAQGLEQGLSVISNLPLDVTDALEGNRRISINDAIIVGNNITFEASRIVSLISNLRPFGGGTKNAEIELDGATIRGESITLDSTTADENLTSAAPDWAQNWLISPALSAVGEFLPTVPFSVMIRGSEANVSVTDSTLEATGDVEINATAQTDSSTSATAMRAAENARKKGANKFWQELNRISAGYSEANSKATAELLGTSQIIAGGSVVVRSDATSKAEVVSETLLNSDPGSKKKTKAPYDPNSMGASIAVTNSNTTSLATIGESVLVTAGGNVNIDALGNVTNNAKAGVTIYVDARGGLGVALGFDTSNVLASIDGKITAGGEKTSQSLVLSNINSATDVIEIPNHGLKTGDELLYLPVNPDDTNDPQQEQTPIGGLVAGETLRVIVLDDNHIQLTRESGIDIDASVTNPNAVHGLSIRDVATFNPALAVNLEANTLTVPKLGIVEGSQVSYAMATSGAGGIDTNEIEPISGLLDGDSYVAINVVVNAANGTTTFQLAALDSPTVPLDLNAGAVGDSHMIVFDREPVTFSPNVAVDSQENTISLPSHGLTTGDALVYTTDSALSTKKDFARNAFLGSDKVMAFNPQAESDFGGPIVDVDANTIKFDDGHQIFTGQKVQYIANGNAIGNLTSGQYYYAVRVDSGTIGLATSPNNADAGTLINLLPGATGTSHELRPSIVDGNEIVVPLHGFQTGQQIAYQAGGGAASLGLVDGQIYYAIVTSSDRLRLANSRQNASQLTAINLSGNVNRNALEGFRTDYVVSTLDLTQSATIDAANDIITIPSHGLGQGATVVYRDNGETPLAGLTPNTRYRIHVVDQNRIQVYNLDFTSRIDFGPATVESQGFHTFEVIVGDVNATTDILNLGDHQLSTGDLVRYDARGNSPIGVSAASGLMQSGQRYQVVRVNGDEIQLASLDGTVIDLLATDNRIQAITALVPSVSSSIEVPIDDLDLDANQFVVEDHGLQTGDEIRYRSKGDVAIGGLTDGDTYLVTRINANRIQLKTRQGSVVDLTNGASAGAVHVLEKLSYTDGTTFEFTPTIGDNSTVASAIFNPLLQPVIDLASSTLRIPNHGFTANEQVVYLTGGGTSIGGLANGQTYNVVVIDADTVRLKAVGATNPVSFTSQGAGSSHGLERRSTVTVRDLPIRGLQNGGLYYVTVIDGDTIRLSETRQGALASQPINLDATVATGSVHTLKSDVDAGVGIDASLEATNTSTVKSALGGAMMFADLLAPNNAAGMYDSGNRKMAKAILKNDAIGRLRGKGTTTNNTFSAAGSFSFNTIEHNVEAFVGPTAVIKSGKDVDVTANIEQTIKAEAQATVISDDGGTTTTQGQQGQSIKKSNRTADKKFAGSVGSVIGDLENNAQAIVDSRAVIDASNDTKVQSSVSYPLLITPIQLVPFVDLQDEPKPKFDQDLLGEVAQTISGKLGLTDIVNVWVVTSTSGAGTTTGTGAAKYTLTGSLAFMNYDNASLAIVREGAQINQDPAYQTAGQSVFVDAETSIEMVNVAGNALLNLNVEGVRNAATAKKDKAGRVFSLLGNKAGSVGVGGSALVQLYDNETQAVIEEGARVRTGNSGVLSVNAVENVFTFDFVQAGGESGKAGVSGSLSVLNHNSNTVAHIEGATTIAGEDVDVGADSSVSHIALTGAVQLGKSFGAGVSVGSQDINRRTVAIVGDEVVRFSKESVDEATDQIELPKHGLSSGDRVVYRAAEGGDILGGLEKGKTYYVIVVDSDHIALATTLGGTPLALSKAGSEHWFHLVAGNEMLLSESEVSVPNQTLTYVDHGLQTGDVVVYEAALGQDLTGLVSGAAYFVIRLDADRFKLASSRDNAANGIAIGGIGAATVGSVHRFTRALAIDAADVAVLASTSGSIWTFGVAGAVADNTEGKSTQGQQVKVPATNPPPPVQTGVAIAGNVTLNTISAVTQAYVNSAGIVELTPAGSLDVSATDSSSVLSISGAVALARQNAGAGSTSGSTAVGLAGSFSRNETDFATEAFVARLDSLANGEVSVVAERTGGVFALSAGMAGSQATSTATTQKNKGAALGGSVSWNSIDTATRGAIDGANLKNVGDVAIRAYDDADLHAIGGGLGITIGGQLGVGIGVGINDISTSTQSSLVDSSIVSNGSVGLETTNLPKIHGVGISAGAGEFGLAGTVGVNTVDFQTESRVVGSQIDSAGNVALSTRDESEIRSDAGAVSLGIKRSQVGQPPSSAVAGALGVAVAINSVGTKAGSSVGSFVIDSDLNSSGDVLVETVSAPRIEALTLAGSVAVAQNTGNQPTGALAGAAAASQNTINTIVESSIVGSSVQAVNVRVSALDQSSILADAGGVGIAAALGAGNSGALGIGAGIALNQIGGRTTAIIENSQIQATGNVSVTSTVNPPSGSKSIEALAIAGAASVGISTGTGQAGALAGAAAITVNEIHRNVIAEILDSEVVTISTTQGDVVVVAADHSTINADAGGVAIAVAASSTGNSGAVSLGASVAENRIGNGTTTGKVIANVENSSVQADGAVQVNVQSEATIDALAIIGAISVGVASTGNGVTVAGAGAGTGNSIRRRIAALITGDSDVQADDGVTVTSVDESYIRAYSVGLSVSASVAPTGTGAALAIGASVTQNTIDNEVIADISSSSITSGGDVVVTATSSQSDLFTLTSSGPNGLSAAQLDDLATSVSDDEETTDVNEYDVDRGEDNALRAKLIQQFRSNGISLSANANVAALAEGNGWMVADAVSGKTYTILREANGSLTVQKNSISAVAAAASVSVAVGQNGIALSGGGAGASNVVLTRTEATVRDSQITSTGSMAVQALNSSGIASTVVAASIGVGVGTMTAGVAAAIGASYAENYIGFDRDDNRSAATSLAEIDGGNLNVDGNLNINAATDQKIGSVVFAASIAAGVSTGVAGVALAGAGANSTNKIAADAIATLSDSSSVQAGDVSVTANDQSVIGALAGAASVAVGVAGTGAGVGVSIGVGLARNTIDTQVLSTVDNVALLEAANISVTSDSSAKIDAVAFAASIAVGAASTVGVGVAGAGAEATNSILGATRAEVRNSNLQAASDVIVDANSSSEIDAKVLALSVGVGAGGTAGIAASVGAGVARNMIGWSPDGNRSIIANYRSDAKILGLNRDQTVRIVNGPRAGEVYRYLGDNLTGTVDLSLMNYHDSTIWLPLSLVESASIIWAGTTNSSVTTTGNLTIDATANQSIESLVVGGSVAVGAAGTAGISGAVGGSYSENRLSTSVRAFIDGDGSGIEVGDVSVTATDSSQIAADTVGIAVAGGFSGVAGVALSVGFAAAENLVANKVNASIKNADQLTASGDVIVAANVLGSNQPNVDTISATAVAASLGVGIAGVAGVGVSGAGAGAKNVILTEADALIVDSSLSIDGKLDMDASSNASINAEIAGVAAAGGGGGVAGVGAAIGVAIAENRIGFNSRGQEQDAGVRAEIIDSSVEATGEVLMDAIANQRIHAGVGAGGMAIAGSAIAGVSVAGAGVGTKNLIRQDVIANIAGDGQIVEGATVRLQAADRSTIDAEAGAVAITVSAALAGASVSVAGSTSNNEIGNTVSATISGLDRLQTTAGGVSVVAQENADIIAHTFAASSATSISIGGAVSVGQTMAKNTITTTTTANINGVAAPLVGASMQSAGPVVVSATDRATIDADIEAASQAAGLGSIAVGVTIAENRLFNTVESAIQNSSLQVSSGGVSVTANADPNIDTSSIAVAVAASAPLGGAAGAGVNANTEIRTATNAFLNSTNINALGQNVIVHATSDSLATPDAKAASGTIAGLSVSVVEANAVIGGTTRASLGGQSTINAGLVDVVALDTNTAQPTVRVDATGALAVSSANLTVAIERGTEARVDDQASLVLTGGSLNVGATSNSSAIGDMASVGVGALTVSLLNVDSQVRARTIANLGEGSYVAATGAVTVDAVSSNSSEARTNGVGAGLLTVSVNRPVANVNSFTQAESLGNLVAGTVTVRATGVEDSTRAGARVIGVGGIGIDVSNVDATTTPTVKVNAAGSIVSTGNV